MRQRTSAPALVEQNDAVFLGIEQLPVRWPTAATGTAVQKHHRLASRIAAHLPVHLMTVADIEHAAIIGIDGGIQGAQRSSGSRGTGGTCHCSYFLCIESVLDQY